ncbi:MAG: SDR family NAD(P)-dependent oxidoreductase [Lachnospiraceae bacterium]|nr:SDR family NAD(P)-dependent oxidoreductase [Lachnospiraceae bacterium]
MEEKTAVIVGGTGQIGQYIIEVLQKEGYLTICVSSKPLPDIAKNQSTEYHIFNMSNPKDIEKCFDKITEKHSSVECLINIIGKNRSGNLNEITEEMWDDVINTNLKSIFFICRTFRRVLNQTKKS